MLPAFDTYLLGYHDRGFAVDPAHQGRVFHGGEIVPVILLDGNVIGTWRYAQPAGRTQIAVTPFSPLKPAIREGIAEEAEDIGRFFGLKTALAYNKGA